MIIDPVMKRRGWYSWPDGVAYKNLFHLGVWRVRLFDFGVGIDPHERRGIEVAHPVHVAVRVGLLTGPWMRRLVKCKLDWPQVGSGYWKAMLTVDVFAITIRGWHDAGEASYLS